VCAWFSWYFFVCKRALTQKCTHWSTCTFPQLRLGRSLEKNWWVWALMFELCAYVRHESEEPVDFLVFVILQHNKHPPTFSRIPVVCHLGPYRWLELLVHTRRWHWWRSRRIHRPVGGLILHEIRGEQVSLFQRFKAYNLSLRECLDKQYSMQAWNRVDGRCVDDKCAFFLGPILTCLATHKRHSL